MRDGKTILQVVALRDDVLRIRQATNGVLPEDASWAVPQAVRQQAVNVSPENAGNTIGFQTKILRVRIERGTWRLSVTDLQGHVLQEDAIGWPLQSHGNQFRVYKKMPDDEHYFGLGDKVGPLDRRGQSFRLWNTDSFGYQESTDPIYKSIPFFITMRAGRSMGFLLDNTWSTSFDFGRVERGPVFLRSGRWPYRLLRLLWTRPQASSQHLCLAYGFHAPSTFMVPWLPAVALQLRN